jgi:hypothetical protein
MNFKLSRRSGTLASVVRTNLVGKAAEKALCEIRNGSKKHRDQLESCYRIEKVQFVSSTVKSVGRAQNGAGSAYPVL